MPDRFPTIQEAKIDRIGRKKLQERAVDLYKKSACRLLFLDILLQATKSFFSSLKNVIILANSKAKIIFCDVGIFIGVKLCWRNGSHPYFLNEEPSKFEVTRATGHVRGERIVFGQLDRGEVRNYKIATFRIRVL